MITSLSAFKCSRRITAPVGLFGYGKISTFVLSVMAFSSSSGVKRNSFSAFVAMETGTPPAIRVSGS